MPYDILFHPKAEKEYLEAYDWYEQQQKGLGARFEHFIEKQLHKISFTLSFTLSNTWHLGNAKPNYFLI